MTADFSAIMKAVRAIAHRGSVSIKQTKADPLSAPVIFAKVVNGKVVNRALFNGEPPSTWPERELWFKATDDMQIDAVRQKDGSFVRARKAEEPSPPALPDIDLHALAAEIKSISGRLSAIEQVVKKGEFK